MSDGMIRGVNKALHMLKIGETLGPQQTGLPRPMPIPSHPTSYYQHPRPMMSDPRPQFRMQRPTGTANLPMPLGHQIPRVGENVPIFDPPEFRPGIMGPRGACNRSKTITTAKAVQSF